MEVEKRTVEGDPAQRICELAEAEDVQLVVVGNKGMAGVRRFLGSVPNKVAHEVPSDVLIVKTVDRSIDDLDAGHGGLVSVDGRQLAVYRDDEGNTYELSPSLHPHGLHGRLERQREDLGLPVSRVAVRRRRIRRARARVGAARTDRRVGTVRRTAVAAAAGRRAAPVTRSGNGARGGEPRGS